MVAASLFWALRSVCAAAENARQRCGLRFLHRDVTSRLLVMTQAPQAGAPITVLVKRKGVPGIQYAAIKGVDVLETVDDLKARWLAHEQLDVRPSLVTLQLVKRGGGKPTAKQEEKAKVLDDPSLSLAEVKVTGKAWLLAFVAGTEGLSARVDSSGTCMVRTPLHLLHSRAPFGRNSSG